ncbi:MAG TPA: hypothetical protein VHB49_04570 [Bradyrhizobium sp.]|nr:hypothetical protein [Bradyrhizobium sp.]
MNAMNCHSEVSGTVSELKRSGESMPFGVTAEVEHSAPAPFQRPGPDVLSEAIPAFFIGRNQNGFWVARDAGGKSGGLFWSREAALRFASNVWPEGCATILPQERFELDIENTGNPLISWLDNARNWLARHDESSSRLPGRSR